MRSAMRTPASSSLRAGLRTSTRARHGRMMPIVFVLIFAGLLAAGLLPRLAQSRARADESARSTAVPTVFTEPVKRDTTTTPFELPATLTGVHEASIFARTNGFVRQLRVDIGSPVRAGDTLVVLDMPELREQERQATAVLEQTEASAKLAKTSLDRWKQLATQGVVTPQEFDERTATANVTDANARAARANLANLRELQRFGVLVAPFHGVVTARSIDIGSLVVAGAAAGARPLLSLVQTDTVRVMLQVPQSAAPRVRVGMRTAVVVSDLGNEEIMGTVVRTAGAIDPVTRTLLTEVHVPNAQRRLLPGMFATVRLKVPSSPSLRVPAIALIVRGDGTQVARVEKDTVRLVPITIGRDYGTSLEVLGGLQPGDQVVVNPPESMASGQPVKAIARGGVK
ncbi:MAG TPA: efflux RND transporter periplasmic adaptor subunit [Gemmatimonas aurantiaca]|uniref:Efflux RND transporter periplasmic adaptor subunit n=3 Tax=Gemmatimonas aurantiaca TaxID=173480 RepID=A0A3D4V7N0_9BACT|nr:efflux RND transporter periplasmic adaptor subunit [Gemmatimonas aurantiaca]